MRDFINGILTIIKATSLTDDEFDTVTATLPIYDQDSYDDISAILSGRESVSVYQDRLLALYQAHGAEITPAKTGKSNILIGGVCGS